MNSDNYGVVSRNMPDKMNESLMVPELICRDVRATKRRFNAINGNTFSTAGTEIRIPIAGNFVLGARNTNVNFRLKFAGTAGTNTPDAAAYADFSWHSMFSQVRIESGAGSSIILEQVDEPGVLAAFVGQYTYSQEEATRANALGLGIEDAVVVGTGSLNKTGTAILLATSDPTEITLDLSTVLGLFTTSLPLYSTNGITVVFTLNQFAASGYYPTVNTGVISSLTALDNVYITCNCLEGGEKYEKDLQDAKTKNGEVSVMFNTVRRYVQPMAQNGATGGSQILINDRAKSCLGFFAISRTSSDLLSVTALKNSSSSFAGYVNHSYNIAGQMYPMAGISTVGECTDESFDTLKHLSRYKNTNGGLINRLQSNPKTTYASGPEGTSGIVAVNLSKCDADEHVWGKGLNLSGSNLSNYLNVSYTPAAASTINIYSIFQMKVHIDKMGGFSTEF